MAISVTREKPEVANGKAGSLPVDGGGRRNYGSAAGATGGVNRNGCWRGIRHDEGAVDRTQPRGAACRRQVGRARMSYGNLRRWARARPISSFREWRTNRVSRTM